MSNSSVSDLLYAPSEGIFSIAGPIMWKNGWSVFPQERNGARKPGKAGGKSILWGRLCETPASQEEIDLWGVECGQLNVACALGVASGNTFALDIDCLDPDLSEIVKNTAIRILGDTPFKRIGRAPKIALIYRYDLKEPPKYFSRKFLINGVPSESGLEILPSGRALTMHGLHHVTGRYFNWPEGSPLISRPDEAPIVTPAMLDELLAEIASKHPFAGNETTGALKLSSEDWADSGGIRVPVTGSNSGQLVDANGKITDGREQYLLSLVYHVVTGNKNALIKSHQESDISLKAFIGKICRATSDIFQDNALIDGKWKTKLSGEIQSKIGRLSAKVIENPEKFPSFESTGKTFTLLPEITHINYELDPELAWMRRSPRIPVKGWYEKTDDKYPLTENRDSITKSVGDGIEESIDKFLDEVFDESEPRLHILDAPTGGGKTSRTLSRIASDPRTYQPCSDGKHKPFVMLLPTYSNIDELRARSSILNLDGSLDDSLLQIEAEKLGLISENNIENKIKELRRDALNCNGIALKAGCERGFVTAIYSGKIRAGCIFPEKVGLAMSVGIGSSAFCRSIIPGDKNSPSVEEVCHHYENCNAIKQRDIALSSHLVFMPHSFLALAIPEELEDVRAVIADERVHHLFLHVGELHLSILNSPRRPPRLTKLEQLENFNAQEILADRNLACSIVIDGLERGECPALSLLAMKSSPGIKPLGLILAENALRICGDGVRRDGKISPATSFEEVREYCSRPVGREIREEMQFWRIIVERIQNILFDREFTPEQALAEAQKALDELPEDVNPKTKLLAERRLRSLSRAGTRAKGIKDARIQLVQDGEGDNLVKKIRISWRTKPNWDGIPTLLLDASASPDISAKIWGIPRDRVIVYRVTKDFGAVLNVKVVGVVTSTYSNSYLVGNADDDTIERLKNSSRLARMRDAISAVCSVNSNGRVVAGAGMLVREAISESWKPPVNLDWCHFGAMRGLDVFKNHSAAISVGRMELPVRMIDGLVGALTYDDNEPEQSFDIRGDGKDPDNDIMPKRLPMSPRAIRMRNGGNIWIEVPCYPGRWASLIQKQYREEELLQFVGRLRPIYRQGQPPIWYACTSVIPEGIIVDDILDIEDMLSGVQSGSVMWDASRRCSGILHPALMSSKCPDLFNSLEDAERLFNQVYNTKDKSWDKWIRTFIVTGQGKELIMISKYYDKFNDLNKILFKPVLNPEILDIIKNSTYLDSRMPDNVDSTIGNIQSRENSEQEILSEIGLSLLNSGSINSKSGIIENIIKSIKVYYSVNQFSAFKAIDKTWNRRYSRDNIIIREGDESPTTDYREAG